MLDRLMYLLVDSGRSKAVNFTDRLAAIVRIGDGARRWLRLVVMPFGTERLRFFAHRWRRFCNLVVLTDGSALRQSKPKQEIKGRGAALTRVKATIYLFSSFRFILSKEVGYGC
jgi:hypothetical protein